MRKISQNYQFYSQSFVIRVLNDHLKMTNGRTPKKMRIFCFIENSPVKPFMVTITRKEPTWESRVSFYLSWPADCRNSDLVPQMMDPISALHKIFYNSAFTLKGV